ncbi:MAG: HD domain-containing protein [Phycisphaerales bacterium]|nr:HD domain-containing protein [Phycisphaerales bacterium]
MGTKAFHEIRDPVHVFVRLDSDERTVLDSQPFQRLRYIHQLALTYLVYPGTTHKRFEHSLGVMELAGRIFDVVTDPSNTDDNIKQLLPELFKPDQRAYWRRVVRLAALCHDMGHLPFSHAAEEMLPDGVNHEQITAAIISSPELGEIWQKMTPPLRTSDVIKLALGPKKAKGQTFSLLEGLLSEIIVGDAFGADRMDYLLRDSYHAGVAYGRFDHYRLVDTLRILPPPPSGEDGQSDELQLGVEHGGIHSAEALNLARYFMYSQLYFHPVRRIYNIHLMDFLRAWLPNGKFETSPPQHILMTDNEVTAAIANAARTRGAAGEESARRIAKRQHFRLVYQQNPDDAKVNGQPARAVYNALCNYFDPALLRLDAKPAEPGSLDFPVRMHDGRIVSSLAISKIIQTLPAAVVDFVFADPGIATKVRDYVRSNRTSIIKH